MQRETEPELMLDPAQAEAYALADFEQPHQRFIELFRETFPNWAGTGWVLDLGCGPGDIARRFAMAYPECRVEGVDGAPAMLAASHHWRTRQPEIAARVTLHCVNLPHQKPPRNEYDAVISNSLLHHLHRPEIMWQAIARYARPGAPILVVDLLRPPDRETAMALTARYCQGEPPVLQHDFFHSLLAAFTVDEIRAQLAASELANLRVLTISDRHWMACGYRS